MQLTMRYKYMTLNAAAEYVGCSDRTIERWSERGYISRFKAVFDSRSYAYSVMDVMTWAEDIRKKRKHSA